MLAGLARRFRYVSSEQLDDEDWLRETDSGEYVGRSTAYTYGAWFRAVSLVSSCVAKTTLTLWDQRGGQRRPARDHYGYKLLCGHYQPNDETLTYHFIQTLTAHAMGHGGGFAAIIRDDVGRAVELLQLRPDRTFPMRENGRLMFVTSIGGDYGTAGAESVKLLAENVLHIHGLGWDGLTGYSVQELAARSIGSAIAKERFGARFFRNSATPSVVIKSPRKLSDHAMKHLKESWEHLRTGIDKAHKPVILEDEAEVVPFSHTAEDSQLLESVMHDPVIISNFTGVPPFLLGVKGYNSNSTLETQSQNLLDFTIDPWFIPWEEELNCKCLREKEKAAESHAYRFNRKDLIRVDAAKRSAIYRTGLGGHPYMKVSEVRADEGLDLEPDTDFIPKPLNMTGNGSDDKDEDYTETDNTVDETGDSNAGRAALRQLWRDTAGRMARRLQTAKSRNAAADAATLLADHGATLRAAFDPLVRLTSPPGTVRRHTILPENISAEMCRAVAAGEAPDDVVTRVLSLIDSRG